MRMLEHNFNNWFGVTAFLISVISVLSALAFGLPVGFRDSDVRALARFQNDLFAELSGQEARYGREDAKELAGIFLEIPEAELDERFSEFSKLAFAYTDNIPGNFGRLQNEFSGSDLEKIERVSMYSAIIESGYLPSGNGSDRDDVRDTVLNKSTRANIIDVLKGGAPPEVGGADVSVGLSMAVWGIWLSATQFAVFFIYFLIAAFNGFHPFSVPEGRGYKIALAATLPGSLPLFATLAVASFIRRAVSARKANKRERTTTYNLSEKDPGENIRASLERLRKRAEEM